jgi:hypothetical protein
MKIARYLPALMLGLFAMTKGASADPTPPDSSSSDPTTDNPYTQYDPDGVPLAVTHPQARPLTQAEINAINKQQAQAELDRNWLLRDYEQQLKIHAANSSQEQDTNLYYQLSSNKDLARLAGLPSLDADGQESTAAYQANAIRANPGSISLRPDASSASMSGSLSHGDLFKPQVIPLSAPDAEGLHNFYSSQPGSLAPSFFGNSHRTPPAPKPDQSPDSSDMETPGMVAAEKNPDLTLDLLPDESIEQAKAHENNNAKLELSLPMDASQLHNEQSSALHIPGVPNAAQPPTAAKTPTVQPVPIEDPNAPLPVSKEQQINPVREPIANPFDILDR